MSQTIGVLRQQESPTCDLSLSQLHLWAKGLGVPATELLSDCYTSDVQRLRGLAMRTIRVANELLSRLPEGELRNVAESLRGQVLEVMPEADTIQCLPEVGTSYIREFGRVAEMEIPVREYLQADLEYLAHNG